MPANVENMFSVRQVPWHGLGTIVQEAPTSDDALKLAGLDWKVIQKTLNLALSEAQRTWTTIHVGDIKDKLEEAQKTLLLSMHYMKILQTEAAIMATKSISDKKVLEFINKLLPIPENAGQTQANNIDIIRTDIKLCYQEAPDLQDMPKNAWRFINAVSDTATHMRPLRRTETYQENMFSNLPCLPQKTECIAVARL